MVPTTTPAALERLDRRIFKPRPQSQFDCYSMTVTLAAGERVQFDALNFFGFSAISGSGTIDVGKRGMATVIALERRQVIGDIQDVLGQLWLVNNSGSSVTVTAITSNREIEWTDTSAIVIPGAAISTPAAISIAAEARTTARTPVADGQAVRPIADKLARLVIAGTSIRELTDNNLVSLTTAAETTLVPAVAAIANDITALLICNRDSVAHWVDIRDATAGTIRASIAVQAGDSAVVTFARNALKQSAVNANWTAQLNAVITTQAVIVSCISERVS